jgi:hypothetical protein
MPKVKATYLVLSCRSCDRMEIYHGTSKPDARASAKEEGWRISKDKTKAWCRNCSRSHLF